MGDNSIIQDLNRLRAKILRGDINESVSQIEEMETLVRNGGYQGVDLDIDDQEIDYWECRGCGFKLDASVFEEKPSCPRRCDDEMAGVV